jgi:hypothetical protein
MKTSDGCACCEQKPPEGVAFLLDGALMRRAGLADRLTLRGWVFGQRGGWCEGRAVAGLGQSWGSGAVHVDLFPAAVEALPHPGLSAAGGYG